ncbi:hypothetical protein Lbir_2303 [Legionella birminghamensis]|uniref:Uncharacterized protein n=2 Tax=Legionella birminghamensis TaxID=28083 RepID=A0A378IDL3_9GAMM|nr:hypothetical protein Lbir_2303 [Legionella birminghamensis]STX33289.1 Uncharacterised protein [Legionella birminghamensis]
MFILSCGRTIVQVKQGIPSQYKKILTLGLMEKILFCDDEHQYYLGKKPAPLAIAEVYRGYIPDSELRKPSPVHHQHIYSLQLESAFIEVLVPIMARALFSELLVTPENYLIVDQNKEITLISKIIPGFEEFLAKKECVNSHTLFYNKQLPTRKDLQLNEKEAEIIGVLYAVALVFNLWDLLNSSLQNSGYVGGINEKRACIVDFGCALHLGYKGRHADSLSADDPQFASTEKLIYPFTPDYFRDHYRHQNALPFDVLVGPLLPHMIIHDLFELSGTDEFSRIALQSFESCLQRAKTKLLANPVLLPECISEAKKHISLDEKWNEDSLFEFLNECFYQQNEGHNLCNIIAGRLESTLNLAKQFKQGIPALEIQEEVRDCYYLAQPG